MLGISDNINFCYTIGSMVETYIKLLPHALAAQFHYYNIHSAEGQ